MRHPVDCVREKKKKIYKYDNIEKKKKNRATGVQHTKTDITIENHRVNIIIEFRTSGRAKQVCRGFGAGAGGLRAALVFIIRILYIFFFPYEIRDPSFGIYEHRKYRPRPGSREKRYL